MEFPPPTSAPLPPIPSSKRHDFSSRVSLFLVPDRQEDLSKALLKGSIFYLQRFLHRDRFSNACKKRDVACNWQDLLSVKFNRDPGFVVNFSKQTHNTTIIHPYWKYIVTWSVWEITYEESFGVIFAEYKGAFYSSEAQFAETGSNVKVQESIGVKSTVRNWKAAMLFLPNLWWGWSKLKRK